jgi:hypothetical protein
VHRNVFWALDVHKKRGEKYSPWPGSPQTGERADVSECTKKILTPADVEGEYTIPRASQKKGRAKGSFAPYFRVGRRVYYRRCVLEAWIADQEQRGGDHPE